MPGGIEAEAVLILSRQTGGLIASGVRSQVCNPHKLGTKVLLSTLARGISGKIGQENDEFVIRINRHEAKHRQRFTLAHKIAY